MYIWESTQYREIWVERKETEKDERAMMALINGDWAGLCICAEKMIQALAPGILITQELMMMER